MELPNRATEITLEQFPPYPLPTLDVDKTEHIANYLFNMFSKSLPIPNSELFLPPLCQMAVFFKSSEMKTYDAFLRLRKQDFDFNLVGLDNAIQIWRKNSNQIS